MAFFCRTSPGVLRPDGTEERLDPNATQRILAVGCGEKLVVATVAESRLVDPYYEVPWCVIICSASVSVTELSVPGDSSGIVCAAVSSSSLCVAACTDSKTLAVWRKEGGCWAWQGKRYGRMAGIGWQWHEWVAGMDGWLWAGDRHGRVTGMGG
jgi:hypothetical protein